MIHICYIYTDKINLFARNYSPATNYQICYKTSVCLGLNERLTFTTLIAHCTILKKRNDCSLFSKLQTTKTYLPLPTFSWSIERSWFPRFVFEIAFSSVKCIFLLKI
jgi:hypothetical protein